MLTGLAAAAGALLVVLLLLPLGWVRLPRRAWWFAALALGVAGAAGLAGAALIRGVHSPLRLLAESAVGAAVGIALLNLGPTGWPRRLVALVAIPCLAVVAVGVTLVPAPVGARAGAARTLLAVGTRAGTGLGGRGIPAISTGPGYPGIARWSAADVTSHLASTSVPGGSHGDVGSVVIPGTRSHFPARPAIVYLPPAAFGPHPPALPVVIALSGQSHDAGPLDVVAKGRVASIMDGIAQHHDGVAPIVVVPDQLGPGSPNPMCVDSRLGHVATYITADVRDWVLAHLPVSHDRRDWTIAGFSEGGTCAIQFGAGRPDLFGALLDVSGEEAPRNGTVAHTIAVGFGSAGAYAAASPFHLLASHRYTDTQAYFAVGALDHRYGPVEPVMAERARQAGMTTHLLRVPALAHTWVTAAIALRWGLDALAPSWPAEATATRTVQHKGA